MCRKLRLAGAVLAVVATVLTWAAAASVTWAAEVAGVLTEVRKGQGDVRVKPAGQTDWKPGRPLMSLHAGDQVRVEGNATAGILLTGGGSKTVTAKDSPFTVSPPTAAGGSGAAKTVIASVARILAGKQEEPSYLRLTSRSVGLNRNIPAILSPRETRVLQGPVKFAWDGSDALRYSIEVIGREGRLWTASDLARRSVAYPASAPPLRPGERYQWVLQAAGYPALRSWFEMASEQDAVRIRSDLALIDPSQLKDFSESTIVLMRAGLLFNERCYQEALDELAHGIETYKDEPTLRYMAAHVYDQIGLQRLAAQYFEEARTLSGEK